MFRILFFLPFRTIKKILKIESRLIEMTEQAKYPEIVEYTLFHGHNFYNCQSLADQLEY